MRKRRVYDRDIERVLEDAYPAEGTRLRALFGVGPTTALYFIAIIGNPARFPSGRRVGSYLGFAVRRRQSGASDPKLGITKSGATLLRALLVGVANDLMSTRAPDSALRDWARRRTATASPVEKKRIKVALARKVGVLMWHLLRTGQNYEPYPNGAPRPPELQMIRASL